MFIVILIYWIKWLNFDRFVVQYVCIDSLIKINIPVIEIYWNHFRYSSQHCWFINVYLVCFVNEWGFLFLQHLNAEQAYELQVSNLTRSVGNLEEAMRQTEEDKQNLLEDLTAVRELCAKLEVTKESIQRQLTSTSLDKEQVKMVDYFPLKAVHWWWLLLTYISQRILVWFICICLSNNWSWHIKTKKELISVKSMN